MTNEILDTCYIEVGLRTIVGFSHIIPVILSLFLAIFVFIKTKYNLFSKKCSRLQTEWYKDQKLNKVILNLSLTTNPQKYNELKIIKWSMGIKF